MTETVFKEFWEKSSGRWYEEAKISVPEISELQSVKDYCSLKDGIYLTLFNRYTALKTLVKDVYFKDATKKLSCYKRAAVLTQVILMTDPLEYNDKDRAFLDPLFLKQRLALCVALDSIIQAYEAEDLTNLEKPYFKFAELDLNNIGDDDGFELSVYKDMFYAELYENYNVLTMANVFGLLTERASSLSNVEQRMNSNHQKN